MHDDLTSASYLRDLGSLVRDVALKTKQEHDGSRGSDAEQFLLGRLGALHEVLSLMQQQAAAFDMPLSSLTLDGFDPDNELL